MNITTNYLVLGLVLCLNNMVVMAEADSQLSYEERYALAQDALDEIVAHASLKDRFLAWLPGKRKEGSVAREIQQLKEATWESRKTLLEAKDTGQFMMLLKKYENELKAAAVALGLVGVTALTVKGMRERGERNKNERELAAQRKANIDKARRSLRAEALKVGAAQRKAAMSRSRLKGA